MTPWGKSHLHSIYTLVSTLKLPGHKNQVASIQWTWWATWLSTGKNRCRFWLLPATLDSCPSAGVAFSCGDWLYSQWANDCSKLTLNHINTNELAAVVLKALCWWYLWKDHDDIIQTMPSPKASPTKARLKTWPACFSYSYWAAWILILTFQ